MLNNIETVIEMVSVLQNSQQFIHYRMLEIGGGFLFLGLLALVFIIALIRTQHKLKKSYSNVLYSLVLSLEARDIYSAGHSMRVASLSKQIAMEMGLKKKMIEIINRAGLLHDIGKIGIPDNILLKPDRLNPEEFNKIKEHPLIGSSLLQTVHKFYEKEIEIIEAHHERWDGLGYPRRLNGDIIPLGARILAAADTFDAMTSDRPYRKALSTDHALDEILRHSGTQFDPDIVAALQNTCKASSYNVGVQEYIVDYQI